MWKEEIASPFFSDDTRKSKRINYQTYQNGSEEKKKAIFFTHTNNQSKNIIGKYGPLIIGIKKREGEKSPKRKMGKEY